MSFIKSYKFFLKNQFYVAEVTQLDRSYLEDYRNFFIFVNESDLPQFLVAEKFVFIFLVIYPELGSKKFYTLGNYSPKMIKTK